MSTDIIKVLNNLPDDIKHSKELQEAEQKYREGVSNLRRVIMAAERLNNTNYSVTEAKALENLGFTLDPTDNSYYLNPLTIRKETARFNLELDLELDIEISDATDLTLEEVIEIVTYYLDTKEELNKFSPSDIGERIALEEFMINYRPYEITYDTDDYYYECDCDD